MKRRTLLATAAALTLPFLALGLLKPALAQDRCTHETLNIQGTALTAGYCVTAVGSGRAGSDLPVTVAESYATEHGSWSQQSTLRFIAGEESSRVIQDIPLDRVGLHGTLHLTLVLQRGLIRIDSAMLTPGAITIK